MLNEIRTGYLYSVLFRQRRRREKESKFMIKNYLKKGIVLFPLFAAAILFTPHSAYSQNENMTMGNAKDTSYSPPSKPIQPQNSFSTPALIGTQIAAGSLLGVLGLVVGGTIGYSLSKNLENSENYETYNSLGTVFIGATVGFIALSSFGIYEGGKMANHGGKYIPTLAGSIIGPIVIGFLGNGLLKNNTSESIQVPYAWAFVLSPIIGGIVGYSLSDRIHVDAAFIPQPSENSIARIKPTLKDLQLKTEFILLRL